MLSRRAMITFALAGGVAIAAAALAAALAGGRLFLPGEGLWVVVGIVALSLFAHAARRRRGSGINRLHHIVICWQLATLVAIVLLGAVWAAAALAGLGAAIVLLGAFILAIAGGVLIGMAGMTLANLLSAIRGPARGH